MVLQQFNCLVEKQLLKISNIIVKGLSDKKLNEKLSKNWQKVGLSDVKIHSISSSQVDKNRWLWPVQPWNQEFFAGWPALGSRVVGEVEKPLPIQQNQDKPLVLNACCGLK